MGALGGENERVLFRVFTKIDEVVVSPLHLIPCFSGWLRTHGQSREWGCRSLYFQWGFYFIAIVKFFFFKSLSLRYNLYTQKLHHWCVYCRETELRKSKFCRYFLTSVRNQAM